MQGSCTFESLNSRLQSNKDERNKKFFGTEQFSIGDPKTRSTWEGVHPVVGAPGPSGAGRGSASSRSSVPSSNLQKGVRETVMLERAPQDVNS